MTNDRGPEKLPNYSTNTHNGKAMGEVKRGRHSLVDKLTCKCSSKINFENESKFNQKGRKMYHSVLYFPRGKWSPPAKCRLKSTKKICTNDFPNKLSFVNEIET